MRKEPTKAKILTQLKDETMKAFLPAVHDELAAPAETIASDGRTLCLMKTSTRRGAHSSFCSRCPNLL